MQKQQGFVSIITVITICILLSLLTVAFVKVMNRSQRQVLDSQLSTQANYAAETGINDAIKAIISNPTAIPANDTDCAPTPISPSANVTNQKRLGGTGTDGSTTEEYTCQLISSGVKDVLTTINDQSNRIYPIKTEPTDPAAGSVTVEWEDQAGVNNFTVTGNSAQDYPPANVWGNRPAMLRLTLYTPCAGGCADFDDDALIANQKNFFIKPGTAAGTINLGDADGTAAIANCQAISNSRPFACKITVNIAGVDTRQNNALFMRITPIYRTAAVRFMALSNAGGSPLALYGAQYRIDVTGKANDVYRRLEVRVPLPTYDTPGIGVESATICKKFEWSGSAVIGANPCP